MKSIVSAGLLVRRTGIALASVMLWSSCSTSHFKSPVAGDSFVRKVDFSKAPGLNELAGHAQGFGNEMYPKICALLLDEAATPPRQFDLTVKPLKSRNTGEAHLKAKLIYLNSDYLTNRTDLLEHFDNVLVHEMTHMAVQYKHGMMTFWNSESPSSASWGESIADYARYKLIGTNGWICPECNSRFPHYTSGYSCGGAFLLYLDASYGTNLVRQLVRELRRRSYADEFFRSMTGKSLDMLWAEFQNTPAFKPGAREAQELRVALGYKGPHPPENIQARFDKFVDEHADDPAKRFLKAARAYGKTDTDIQTRITLYLYFTQPGGTAEQFLTSSREKGGLPGYAKGEKGWLSLFLKFEEMESRSFPVTRTFVCNKPGDTSEYHYTVVRASREDDWKIEKAWRGTPDGKVMEEYHVP